MSNQVQIVELREQHVQQAADVLTRSFLQLNNIWKAYNPRFQDVFPIMKGKICSALGKGWSFVLIENKKVIGLSLQYDFLDYLQEPSTPTSLALFAKLSQAGKQLERQLDLAGLKRGEAIYGLFGVIDPDYAKKGYSLAFWWECFTRGKTGGWKYYYSRISSPVSLKMLQHLGAQILAETTVTTQAGQQKIWMIRIDLDNPMPSLSMLQSMTKRKPRQPSASL